MSAGSPEFYVPIVFSITEALERFGFPLRLTSGVEINVILPHDISYR